MTFSDLLQQEKIDIHNQEQVLFLQKFYQEGFIQGMTSVNPNIQYNEQYVRVMSKILNIMNHTGDPRSLNQTEKAIDKATEVLKGID